MSVNTGSEFGDAVTSLQVQVSPWDYWVCSQHLRWRQIPGTTARAPVLEQAWQSNTGKIEWREVPTVVFPDPVIETGAQT